MPLVARSIGMTLRALPARRTSPPRPWPERPETRTRDRRLAVAHPRPVIFDLRRLHPVGSVARAHLAGLVAHAQPAVAGRRGVTVSPAASSQRPRLERRRRALTSCAACTRTSSPRRRWRTRAACRPGARSPSEVLVAIVAEAPAEATSSVIAARGPGALEREPAGDRRGRCPRRPRPSAPRPSRASRAAARPGGSGRP